MAFSPVIMTGFEMGRRPVGTYITRTVDGTNDVQGTVAHTGSYAYHLNLGTDGNDNYVQFENEEYSNHEIFYYGLAFRIDDASGVKTSHIKIVMSSGDDVELDTSDNGDGTFSFDLRVDGTVEAEGVESCSYGSFCHIQVKVIEGENGRVMVKMNGVLDIDHVITVGTGQQYFQVHSVYDYDTYFDDLVIGTDDFPGQVRVVAILPDGDVSNEWDLSSGTDVYDVINTVPPDGEYVYTSVDGEQFKVSFGDLVPPSDWFKYICFWAYGEKDEADDSLKIMFENFDDGYSSTITVAGTTGTSYAFDIVGEDDYVDRFEPDDLDVTVESVLGESGTVNVHQFVAEIGYVPEESKPTLHDWEFAHAGYVVTSWVTLGLLDVPKYFAKIKAFVEYANDNAVLKVDFRTDPDSDWTNAGTITSDDDTQELSLTVNDEYTTGKRIQFRFRWETSVYDRSVNMNAWLLESIPSIPQKRSYTAQVRLEDDHITLFGEREYQSVSAAYQALKDMVDSAEPVVMTSQIETYNNKEVKLTGLSANPIVDYQNKEVMVATLTFLET